MKDKKIGKMLVLAFVVLVVALMPASMGADVIGNSNSPNNPAYVIAAINDDPIADSNLNNNNLNTNNNNLNVNNNNNVDNNLNVNNDNVENNLYNNIANFFNNLRNVYPIFNRLCNILSYLIY